MRAVSPILAAFALGCAPSFEVETDVHPIHVGSMTLADGSRVVSRAGDAPGESELVLEPSGRVLFAAPGADDLPLALPGGKIAFVSSRSTISSLWIGDLRTNEVRQLTNRGLRAGQPRDARFTPPPRREMRYDAAANAIEYDGIQIPLGEGGSR